MSFLTYDETRPWAKAIQEEISERRMPPWDAVKGFGEFRHEASLTPEEIKLFNDWVEGGAPQGDPKYLPSTPGAAPVRPAWRGRTLPAKDGFTLTRDITLLALRPVGVSDGGSLLATAESPEGAVEPLLWIRQFQTKRNRTYELAVPMRLPRGTRIRIEGSGHLMLGVQ